MGEYKVVIGEHVPYVYEEVCKEIGLNHEEGIVKIDKKKESIPQNVLGIVMNAMGPSLNQMCACGMIKGFLVLATRIFSVYFSSKVANVIAILFHYLIL